MSPIKKFNIKYFYYRECYLNDLKTAATNSGCPFKKVSVLWRFPLRKRKLIVFMVASGRNAYCGTALHDDLQKRLRLRSISV